jgi:propionate CoA-transferase
MKKVISAQAAAQLVHDGAIVTVSSSSGLACPDKVLAALGERFDREGQPRDLTTHAPYRGRHVWHSASSI